MTTITKCIVAGTTTLIFVAFQKFLKQPMEGVILYFILLTLLAVEEK